MKTINFNTYFVYYMDNDGQKQIIKSDMHYMQAVRFWQKMNTQEPQMNCNYASTLTKY